MALSVFEEELGARDAMAQVLIERGVAGFTIPFVEAAFFTGGDYFAEVTQYTPSSVICTPRFSVPEGDEGFFKSLMDLYHYNAPFSPSLVPFMYADWWEEGRPGEGLSAPKAERTFSQMKQSRWGEGSAAPSRPLSTLRAPAKQSS